MEAESALIRFLSQLQHKARQGSYVFRGELEATGRDGRERPVTSTLYRRVQDNHRHSGCAIPGRLDPAPLSQAEARRLPALEAKIAGEINRLLSDRPADTDNQKLKLLARVQHFGGPTNLIDFTRDCLVALFFACYDRKEEEQSGGWTGDRRIVDGRIVFLLADDERIVEASIRDARALVQRSVFCAEASGVLSADGYESLCVPGCLKRQLRMYLAQCHDIRPTTLFPDFLAALDHVSSPAILDALWDEVSYLDSSG